MAFIFPHLIRKNTNLEILDDFTLEYWHEQMHIIWDKVKGGYDVPEWSLSDIYFTQKERNYSSFSC